MIATDQPTAFSPKTLVAVSCRDDGTMLDRTSGIHSAEALPHRRAFCVSLGIDYADVVYQQIVYGPDRSYDIIHEVDASLATSFTPGVEADALFTRHAHVGLMLPVADCVATVVYDPVRQYLALVHLGRHSTVARLMTKVIEKFIQEGSDPGDLTIWMSPSAQRDSYVMQWFDQQNDPDWQEYIDVHDDGVYLDLPGFNKAACLQAGIRAENLYVSPVNTMANEHYFSHSLGDVSGRFAVVAMMRP